MLSKTILKIEKMAKKGDLQLLLQCCLFLGCFLCWFLYGVSSSYADSPYDSPVVGDKTVVQNETVVDDKTIVYDETTGHISIHAENASLRALLAKISHHSNVKFLMDPAAEQAVSVFLEKKSLEQGLKLIMRNAGLSHATIYGKRPTQSQPQKIVPISMKILPKGKTDTSNLVPVAPSSSKPANKARRSILNITEKDLKDLPKENAKIIIERLDNLKEKRSKRAAEHKLKTAERKKKREELKQRRNERNVRRPDWKYSPRNSESVSDSETDLDSE